MDGLIPVEKDYRNTTYLFFINIQFQLVARKKILDDFLDCTTLFEILITSGQILFWKSKKPLTQLACDEQARAGK